jgi:hypothetical protein
MRVVVPSLVASAAVAVVLVACGSSSAPVENSDTAVAQTIVAACTATVPPSCSGPTPHYADALPILQKSCIPCHPGPPGSPQWPLTKYTDIQPWAGVIEDEICGNAMPPLDGGIAITQSDRLTLLDWSQCGAPY